MKMLVAILNYNNNDNAKYLHKIFSKFGQCYIIDSGSKEQLEEFIPSDTPFYVGNLNKANELFLNSDSQWCLYICSDVIIAEDDANKIVENIANVRLSKIGCFAPSIKGKSVPQMKKKNKSGYRKVIFVEGIIFAVQRIVIERLHPFDTTINSMGHGIDVLIAHTAKKCGLRSIVDDSIEVFHPYGTSYDDVVANHERIELRKHSSIGYKLFEYSYSISRIIGKYKRKAFYLFIR